MYSDAQRCSENVWIPLKETMTKSEVIQRLTKVDTPIGRHPASSRRNVQEAFISERKCNPTWLYCQQCVPQIVIWYYPPSRREVPLLFYIVSWGTRPRCREKGCYIYANPFRIVVTCLQFDFCRYYFYIAYRSKGHFIPKSKVDCFLGQSIIYLPVRLRKEWF